MPQHCYLLDTLVLVGSIHKIKKKIEINLPESSAAFVQSKRNVIRNKVNELIELKIGEVLIKGYFLEIDMASLLLR